MQLNRVEITICGKKYPLSTSENPEYVKELARQLEDRINRMMQTSDMMTISTATVLVALDILDESLTTNSNIDNIRTQIKTYVEEAANARNEASECKKELEEAKRKIAQMETDMQLLNLQKKVDTGI
ncbi:MAG TPA: cell division protein ZapA [Firmicutes bacterium]|nr:cell division protein ZapA [Bacillota bacterium]